MDIQATAVSYKNKGILIQGRAGVGKTTLALKLIELGAVFIGDDVVKIYLKNNKLYCEAKEELKGIAEVRGLGLVSGFKTAKPAPVLCLIRLHEKPVERLPKSKTKTLLNKKIPVFDFCACNASEISVLYAVRCLMGQMTLLKE
ncbi:MAG: HPr kinase/phosphatase C-terminal domain-containing protein [Alphaproteobacteria bacterium]